VPFLVREGRGPVTPLFPILYFTADGFWREKVDENEHFLRPRQEEEEVF